MYPTHLTLQEADKEERDCRLYTQCVQNSKTEGNSIQRDIRFKAQAHFQSKTSHFK